MTVRAHPDETPTMNKQRARDTRPITNARGEGRAIGARCLCYGLALALVIQCLTIAAERVAPSGHFHLAALAAHAHDDDDHDGDDHDSAHHDADHHHGDHHHATSHFHTAIGHHEHAPQDHGVVYVDEGTATTTKAAITLKRLALDQEQLSTITPPPHVPAESGAPLLLRARAFRSHVADPLEPPPRLSAS